ncbi:hypothetical protein [Actomonas aquatica]|uniref:Uncharacterized protein n=1 Tax=Actomonas aquatica TaxID=2866162 RepID=A0ABZ1C4Y9_9BACT|nr:hypothetical protein [Opitutus sp. WL0086]WRQ86462.1 hypothetical protein K1X11_016725 [Opitutus sp. WL0086]
MKLMRPLHFKPLFRAATGLRALVAATMGLIALGTTGCNTIAPPAASVNRTISATQTVTGRVLTSDDLRAFDRKIVLGDNSYAQVNSAWLAQFNKRFRSELNRLGITKWDRKFDCNRFTDLYRSLAQADYYRSNFHSSVNAEAIAIGSIWYVRDSTGTRHALVQAVTERGRIFIEPQTGEEIELSAKEIRSTYFAAM